MWGDPSGWPVVHRQSASGGGVVGGGLYSQGEEGEEDDGMGSVAGVAAGVLVAGDVDGEIMSEARKLVALDDFTTHYQKTAFARLRVELDLLETLKPRFPFEAKMAFF